MPGLLALLAAASVIVVAASAAGCGPVGASGGGGQSIDSGQSTPAPSTSASPSGGAPANASMAPDGGQAAVVGDPEAGDGATTSAVSTDATTPKAAGDAGYSVEGATIFDPSHKPHLFHGVDRPSLEWSPAGQQLSQSDYANMAAWKANVVRIALNQDFWLPDSPMHDAGYAALVDTQVRWAEAAGLDVILDLHWSDKGSYTETPGQQRMADAHSTAFWTSVAGRYKSDGRVLFELYNEPHDVPWDVWLGGGASGDGFTVVGMQVLYDAVRGAGAGNLVVIGGLQFAYDLSGVASHRVQGHNIVYATHPYNQTGKQPSNWDAGFGSLSATDPVMATEFGDTTSCGTDYDSALIAYADAHHISWSAWAWFVSGCQFPSIITDWSGAPNAAGSIVKASLASY